MSTEQQINDLVQRWADGERANDASAIEQLVAEDFHGIGPLGFVLNRQQWLGRFAGGIFQNLEFAIDEVDVHDFGNTAVAVCKQTQKATYDGQPSDGSFRLSLVWVHGEDGWRVAHAQLSNLAAAPPR